MLGFKIRYVGFTAKSRDIRDPHSLGNLRRGLAESFRQEREAMRAAGRRLAAEINTREFTSWRSQVHDR